MFDLCFLDSMAHFDMWRTFIVEGGRIFQGCSDASGSKEVVDPLAIFLSLAILKAVKTAEGEADLEARIIYDMISNMEGGFTKDNLIKCGHLVANGLTALQGHPDIDNGLEAIKLLDKALKGVPKETSTTQLVSLGSLKHMMMKNKEISSFLSHAFRGLQKQVQIDESMTGSRGQGGIDVSALLSGGALMNSNDVDEDDDAIDGNSGAKVILLVGH